MSKSESDMPRGRPITTETAAEMAGKAWEAHREDVLRQHGLWERYGKGAGE